jgi:protease-4
MSISGQPTPPEFKSGHASSPSAAPESGREARPTPTMIVVDSSPRVLMKIGLSLLGLALLVSLLFNVGTIMLYSSAWKQYFNNDHNVTERYHSGSKTATDKIAIIDISGLMLQGEGFVKNQIDRVREDDDVKAVVVRINSPGGAVTAADYMFHHLKKLRDEEELPLVVSMGSLAASGGYYAAMAVGDKEKTIYAEPTTITGSIGVIIPRYDVSEFLEKQLDIKSDSIKSHQLKDLGSWTRPLTADERQRLQSQVNLLFERFKEVVREGRPAFRKDDNALGQVATGEVFTGEQAKSLMLVDEVGFIEDAIVRAAELANLPKNKYRVVEFEAPATIADQLIGRVEHSSSFDARTLFEMATPRAYYLYSWLPPLAQ